MTTIYMVITDSGDGSNSIDIIKDLEALEYVRKLANFEVGESWQCEKYASGDGLQERALEFPDNFDVDAWVQKHFYGYTTMEDFE